MIIRELIEARRNPDQNPRISINQAMKYHLGNTSDTVAGVPNLFVSFSDIEKLGVYPRSADKTPIAIYSYPVSHIVDQIGDHYDPAIALPYAGNRKFANMFSMHGNILSLSMSAGIEHQLYQLLHTVLEQTTDPEFKVSNLLDEFIDSSHTDAREPEEPGGRFWYVTYRISKALAESSQSGAKWNNRAPVNWTRLFRMLGIDGLIDPGIGIIHSNEPVQAVTFSINAIKSIDRIRNEYSPQKLSDRKSIRELNTMSEDEQYELLVRKPSWFNRLKDPSKSLLFRLIDSGRAFLHDIATQHGDNQQIQYAIVSSDGMAIRWLENPDAETQMIAVQDRPEYIGYIQEPAVDVQLAAVKAKPSVYTRIKNPAPSVTAWYQKNN